MAEPFRPGPLAIGTAPLGGLYTAVSDDDADATLTAAAEAGVTHFDSAPHYGRGLAESRLGAFLARRDDRDRFTVSTKVGRTVGPTPRRADDDIFLGAPPGESVFDFSVDGVRTQLAASRARLGRSFLDLVLIHDPDDHLDAALVAAEELIRCRDAGDIGAIGVGTNRAAVALHLLDRVPLDAVLLAGRITLLETSGEPVARRCAADGVTLLAAGVFQSGILAGGGDASYDYAPAPADIRAKVADLAAVCARHGVTLHQAAIGHPRRIGGVTSTLVGVRSADEARAAADACAAVVPEECWRELDAARARWRVDEQGPTATSDGGTVDAAAPGTGSSPTFDPSTEPTTEPTTAPTTEPTQEGSP